MLDIGWSELFVVGIVLLVVVGPKELPAMLRTFGRTTTKLRGMAGDFRKQFDEAIKEAELDEVRKLAQDARKLDPTAEIRKNLNPLKKMGDEIKSGLENAVKAPPAGAAAPKPAIAEKTEPAPAAVTTADKPKPESAAPGRIVKTPPDKEAASLPAAPSAAPVAKPKPVEPKLAAPVQAQGNKSPTREAVDTRLEKPAKVTKPKAAQPTVKRTVKPKVPGASS